MSATGFIFDMDGVLVDNNEFHYRSFETFCSNHQLEFSEERYHKEITGRTNE